MVAGGVSSDNKRGLDSQGLSSRFRLPVGPVLLLAFCEGAGLSWRELLTVYAVGSVRSEIWRLTLPRLEDELERGRVQTLRADQLTCQAVQHRAMLAENGHCSRVSFPQ